MDVALQVQRRPARRSLAGNQAGRAARCLPLAHPHIQHGERTELFQVVQRRWRTNPSKYPCCRLLFHGSGALTPEKAVDKYALPAVSVRSAFPGLLLTTLPPSAAAGKGTVLRHGGSGSIPPAREAPRRCWSGRCFPTTALCNHPGNSE